MSQPPAVPPKDHQPTPPGTEGVTQVTVISHSGLFYWWPVWAVGFLMAGLTFLDKHRMAVVPADTEVFKDVKQVKLIKADGNEQGFNNPEDVLVMPKDSIENSQLADGKIKLHASNNKNYGVFFAVALLVVIFITNVPLRGGWSFAFIVVTILVVIILALAGWLDWILEHLSYLDIRINAGGYLFISVILFALWLLTVLVFDRRIYMIFTPSQFSVCTEIGGGVRVYPTQGMALEKQRSDLFRHWILGLGSGDLIIKTSGAQSHEFEMDNVLFIGKKIREIESMMKRVVVTPSR